MFRLPFPLSGDDPITLGDVFAALSVAVGVVGLMFVAVALIVVAHGLAR